MVLDSTFLPLHRLVADVILRASISEQTARRFNEALLALLCRNHPILILSQLRIGEWLPSSPVGGGCWRGKSRVHS
uniref:Uncharacterized protein n=1 Tax=Ditylenchus dipsaci TaxID=166011 RepID=A0A915CPX6_9BILA